MRIEPLKTLQKTAPSPHQTPGRAALAIIAILLCATSCFPNENNPDNGSITFQNQSNQTIIVLSASPPEIQAALDANPRTVRSLLPGSSFSLAYRFSVDPNDDEYCSTTRRVIWILSTTNEGSRSATDYTILDQIGPNKCWDQRDDQYVYTDN